MSGKRDYPNGFIDEIDLAAFDQILDMDEDGDQSFSQQLATSWMDQSEQTMSEIDSAILAADLAQISRLAESMKGSTSTLGVFKVRDGVERVKSFALDEQGIQNESQIMEMIKETMYQLKSDYEKAKSVLKRFYKIED